MGKLKARRIELPTLPPEIEAQDEPAVFSGSTSLALAGRIMMAKHARKLYAHLPGVLSGDDPHDIHQMRVATRRLRASLQSTASAYQPEVVDALRKPLRRLARSLGAVRDRDVLLMRLRADVEQPSLDRGEIEDRIERLQEERVQAHEDLLDELHSKRSARLLKRLNEFLICPLDTIQADDDGLILLVRHHAGSAIWREFEAVQRFETVMPRASSERLHELRIACKHLRYTLELFEPALGKNAHDLIKQVENMQEHLGLIHDADVALAYFGLDGHRGEDAAAAPHEDARSVNDAPTDEHSPDSTADGAATEHGAAETDSPEPAEALILRYAEARIAERDRLLQEFEPMWEELSGREVRRKLGKLIAGL